MVLMAISLIMLMAFAALAIDGGNLYVARNELHNASDAGALAGARMLYTVDGSAVNPGANNVATDAALANYSQGDPVEVASVLRGHWSFATRTFTPNTSLAAVDLFSFTTKELDADPNFINAVEVITERKATPAQAFFGTVLGFSDYKVSARAVAYIGFAGSLRPHDLDQPIGICQEALLNNSGAYECSVGRFIPDNGDTGGWTSFQQNVSGAADANDVNSVTCGTGNEQQLDYGEGLQTVNGQLQSAFSKLYNCWEAETNKKRLWNMTLPVLSCPTGVGPSNKLIGAVNLNIVWIVDQANHIDARAPSEMELPPHNSGGTSPGTWSNSNASGVARWDDFVNTFSIEKPDHSLAHWDSDPQKSGWRQKTIYFLPDCSYHEPKGNTGGENFGVLARIPVLVD
ncbi:Putative Tad-like Flp pilus-assembly [Marinobacter daqiaonensis]|uniref:Putative Tad-like Flp pilus-assembly n=1 Tax=Marinobacter daqiaonensis TaxID=650891 RepID=A0A1I6JGL8_9GAMM|nr:TadG family pilus assembly protein [Marinobacter daqiaonensis]SFR78093.1 Putative Tad-like Flp pilus-assembly [Marinobacter daqiaonensis]